MFLKVWRKENRSSKKDTDDRYKSERNDRRDRERIRDRSRDRDRDRKRRDRSRDRPRRETNGDKELTGTLTSEHDGTYGSVKSRGVTL
jgi:RNA-binding protein 39